MIIHYTSVQGRRESNEDRHNIILNLNKTSTKIGAINLLSIYDGHGGSSVSEYLEKNLPIYYCYPDLQIPFSKEYHNNTFERIQKKIMQTRYGMSTGSTCLVNIIYKYKDEYHMNIVNLGDSRLIIIYNNNQCKQVTVDHKPDDELEKERIRNMGGTIYNDSEGVCRIGDLSLSRAFGDGDNAPYISQKPDVYYKKICKETKYIVMACDGLWDVIPNDDINDLLEQCKKTGSTNYAAYLATEALNKGSTDNVSVIVIEIFPEIFK